MPGSIPSAMSCAAAAIESACRNSVISGVSASDATFSTQSLSANELLVLSTSNRILRPLFQPVAMAVAHDRKDPSAGIAAAIALKATICLKKRLLNDVLRYVGVTAEKACQVL